MVENLIIGFLIAILIFLFFPAVFALVVEFAAMVMRVFKEDFKDFFFEIIDSWKQVFKTIFGKDGEK